MQQKRYQVREYNFGNLVALFSLGHEKSSPEYLKYKPQVRYFDKLCSELGIRTLVFEGEYIDQHFSEDFGGYYAKCHGTYRKKCARLHYFKAAFDERRFVEMILGNAPKEQWDALGYCGFTVIKPLPETLIGRTCISPPPSSSELLKYRYRPHICGFELAVDSLPFQEQDHEVAACATSAVWTVLHGTSRVFDTPVLTPLQITKRALSSTPHHRSSLPNNDGFSVELAAAVFRQLGMETEFLGLDERAKPDEEKTDVEYTLKGALAAYLPLGIPLLLSFDLQLPLKKTRRLHAVAVTGVERKGAVSRSENKPALRSSNISKVYVHDDGVGPYSGISTQGQDGLIETGWYKRDDPLGPPRKAYLADLLVPLYHQIRIRYADILSVVTELNVFLSAISLGAYPDFEWDIFLTTGTDFKREIASEVALSEAPRLTALTEPLPHYVWRVIAFEGTVRQFEFVYDATDLRQGDWLLHFLPQEQSVIGAIRDAFDGIDLSNEDVHKMTLVSLSKMLGGYSA